MDVKQMAELKVLPAPDDYDQIEAQRELQGMMLNYRGNVPVATHRPESDDLMVRGIKENVLAMMMEAAELLDHLPWKYWKGGEPVSEEQVTEVMYEAIDLQHFLNNVYILLGMNKKMVDDVYHTKQVENRRRQREGY